MSSGCVICHKARERWDGVLFFLCYITPMLSFFDPEYSSLDLSSSYVDLFADNIRTVRM